MIECSKIIYEPIDIYMDGKLVFENESTSCVMGMQGKQTEFGFCYSPLSIINDGLIELLFIRGRPGRSGMHKILYDSRIAYDKNVQVLRGESFKIVSKREVSKNSPHIFVIDGEILSFQKFVKFESVPEALEVLVDFDHMMKYQKHFLKHE
jgi:diacylglycerol kinase family enzyme